jgi:hypothetical protein
MALAMQNAATADAQAAEIAIRVFHRWRLGPVEKRTTITTIKKKGAAAATYQYVFSRSNLL